ncbi:MAG: hypothetical protein LBJ64_08040, partial [Deltaproteobacteria bacterium]|nr:hypothetical protein [Deltaproteobacteria bacterium]
MRKYFTFVIASIMSLIFINVGSAVAQTASDYAAQPPLMIGSTKPAILMVVSKDMEMFAPAYVAPADVDGDGDMDVGFNPAVEYTGIFDPYSCYTYVTQRDNRINYDSAIDNSKLYSKTGDNPLKRGHFVRLGPSMPDFVDAAGEYPDSNRLASEIKKGYDDTKNGRPGFRAPRSKTGVCPADAAVTGTGDIDQYGKNMKDGKSGDPDVSTAARLWSGNWLNWMTSSRIDVVRQVLYGGKRVLDTPDTTFLTVEWIPENAGVWGYDDFTQYFWL